MVIGSTPPPKDVYKRQDYNQCIKAITEAESYNGPSIIIAYAPCINHGIKGGMSKAPVSYTHLDVYKRQDLDNQQFIFCSELLSDNSRLIYGEIIDYDLEDPILIRAGLGVCPQDSPGFSHYFGELISEVKFSNGQYTLSNFQYKELDPVQ